MDHKTREKVLALYGAFDNPAFHTRNRFLRAATYMAGADALTGELSAAEIGRMAEVASGGAGTVISGFAYISEEGRAAPKQWGLHCDERIADVKALSAALHKYDTKLVVQICHAGGQTDASLTGCVPLSPSGLPHPGLGPETRAMADKDIRKVISDFAAAARRAKDGGADAVEIHGGHGYLLTQFLSPLTNKRKDGYGGSIENRARLLREILAETKKAVGADFPVWFKISMEEGAEGGYTAADGTAVSRLLMEDGADAIEVSCGTNYSESHKRPTIIGVSAGESEAPFREYARELKKFASPRQTIILTGGLRSLEVMANLLNDGVCDLFGISRPFNAEPDLVNRWAEEDSRPSACVSCNACFNTVPKGLLDCPIIRDRVEGYWDPL